MSLMFVFSIPTLAADVNKIDLKSNLSFTFEPSNTTEKSLTLIPFSDLDFIALHNENVEKIEKDTAFPLLTFAFGMWLAGFIAAVIS